MILSIILFFIFVSFVYIDIADTATVPYRIRMAASTYTAQLKGTSGTRTAGLTIQGTYSSTFKAHEFTITISGYYDLWYDAAGGSNYAKDAAWSGSNGKFIVTGYFDDSIDTDLDYRVDAIDDSVVGRSNLTTTVNILLNNPGSGIAHPPDDVTLEFKITGPDTSVGITDEYLTDSVAALVGDSLSRYHDYNILNHGVVRNDESAYAANKVAANTFFNNLPNQSTVLFPRGTYYLDSLIVTNIDSLTLEFDDNAVIRHVNTGDDTVATMKFHNCDFLHIDGGRWIGKWEVDSSGVAADAGKDYRSDLIWVTADVQIEGIKIENGYFNLAGDRAIRIDADWHEGVIRDVVVQNNEVDSCWSGIYFVADVIVADTAHIDYVRCLNNTVNFTAHDPDGPSSWDNGGYGIQTTGWVDNIYIEGNLIKDIGIMALLIGGVNADTEDSTKIPHNVNIVGNLFDYTYYRTVSLTGYNFIFRSNTVYDSLSSFELSGRNVFIDHNYFYGCYILTGTNANTPGLIRYGQNSWNITDNTFENPTRAININYLENSHVDRNTIIYDKDVFTWNTLGLIYQGNNNTTMNQNIIRVRTGINVSAVLWNVAVNAFCQFNGNKIYIEDGATLLAANLISWGDGAFNEYKENKIFSLEEHDFSQAILNYNPAAANMLKRTWSGSAWLDSTVIAIRPTPISSDSVHEKIILVAESPTGAFVSNAKYFASYDTVGADHWDFHECKGYWWKPVNIAYMNYEVATPNSPSSGDAYFQSSGIAVNNTYEGNDFNVGGRLASASAERLWFVNGTDTALVANNYYGINEQYPKFAATKVLIKEDLFGIFPSLAAPSISNYMIGQVASNSDWEVGEPSAWMNTTEGAGTWIGFGYKTYWDTDTLRIIVGSDTLRVGYKSEVGQ